MTRDEYEHYLNCFHAHDYDGLLDYFAADFEVVFAGYRLDSREQVKDFYGFLHEYLDERIIVKRFLSDGQTIMMEADIELTGKKELSREKLEAKGFGRLVGLPPGVTVVIPQFIHYHLKDGKFAQALCAILELPA